MTKPDVILHVPGVYVTDAEVECEPCLKCGAPIRKRCRSLTEGRPIPQSHALRCNAAINRKAALMRERGNG